MRATKGRKIKKQPFGHTLKGVVEIQRKRIKVNERERQRERQTDRQRDRETERYAHK